MDTKALNSKVHRAAREPPLNVLSMILPTALSLLSSETSHCI